MHRLLATQGGSHRPRDRPCDSTISGSIVTGNSKTTSWSGVGLAPNKTSSSSDSSSLVTSAVNRICRRPGIGVDGIDEVQ